MKENALCHCQTTMKPSGRDHDTSLSCATMRRVNSPALSLNLSRSPEPARSQAGAAFWLGKQANLSAMSERTRAIAQFS